MKRTILDQVEAMPDGRVCLRFIKEVLDGGEWVRAKDWPFHRTMIDAGQSIDAAIAHTNEYLVREGWAPVEDWSKALEAKAAADEAKDSGTLIVNFTKGLVARRANSETAVFDVRKRAECPIHKGFSGLVFTPEVIAADDAALARAAQERAEQEAAAALARQRQLEQAQADFDAAVERVLKARGIL